MLPVWSTATSLVATTCTALMHNAEQPQCFNQRKMHKLTAESRKKLGPVSEPSISFHKATPQDLLCHCYASPGKHRHNLPLGYAAANQVADMLLYSCGLCTICPSQLALHIADSCLFTWLHLVMFCTTASASAAGG
ncbi:TPA: hypothetical protein ACH3X1_005051 [Trebouxia sp. C0004]